LFCCGYCVLGYVFVWSCLFVCLFGIIIVVVVVVCCCSLSIIYYSFSYIYHVVPYIPW